MHVVIDAIITLVGPQPTPALCLPQHESFWVNHYASKVLYTVDGWVERNMDSVPQSFADTMLSSGHQASYKLQVAAHPRQGLFDVCPYLALLNPLVLIVLV